MQGNRVSFLGFSHGAMKGVILIIVVFVLIASSSIVNGPQYSYAAPAAEFSTANATIRSAFTAMQLAESNGGNVTSLISSLNSALALMQKATSENSTNAGQASADLQSAVQIATQVESQSASVSLNGSSQKQIVFAESIGSAATVSVLAILVYLFGDRLYRRIWFYVYRNFTVRPADE